jgi:protease I
VAHVLLVVAPERFRDEELFETREELTAAGHQTTLASTRQGVIIGSRGGQARADLALTEAKGADYAAAVFVGGGGSRLLWDDAEAHRIAQEADAAGRVLGAICLAPVILARAGVLAGRNATVAGTEAAAIQAGGATYTGPGVTVDGRLVTANGPKSSRAFGRALAALLS